MIYLLYLWFLSNTSNNIWHAFKKRCTYSIFFHLHLYFFFGAKYIPQTQIYCNIIELKNLIYSIFILSTVLYVFVFSSQMHSYSKFFRILHIFLYHLLIVFVILAKYIPQFIQIEIHMFFFYFTYICTSLLGPNTFLTLSIVILKFLLQYYWIDDWGYHSSSS